MAVFRRRGRRPCHRAGRHQSWRPAPFPRDVRSLHLIVCHALCFGAAREDERGQAAAAAINPVLCIEKSLPLKLRCPVEIPDIKADRIEANGRLILRCGERDRRDAAEPARADLLALAVAFVLGPVDLIGWFESATMLLTSMATVDDFAFSNGELLRNQSLIFCVDGSEVRKARRFGRYIASAPRASGVIERKLVTKLPSVARTTLTSAYSICSGNPDVTEVPSLSTWTM